MSFELKRITQDVQELAGIPLQERDGNWSVATARLVIKKFFALGLSLEQGENQPSEKAAEG